MELTSKLREEYNTRWTQMQVRTEWEPLARAAARRIYDYRDRYQTIESRSRVPWWMVGLMHYLESGASFLKHLHNGDPLAARTVNVPAGRPKKGAPPFTFEESALDALSYDGLIGWADWSIAGVSFKLEGFNGFGYRATKDKRGRKLTDGRPMPSPYLYSGSYWYKTGKFKSDGVFVAGYTSKQVGCLVILKTLADMAELEIEVR